MSKLLWLDYLFVAALVGVVLIDLSHDLPVLQHGERDAQALREATQYYIHAKSSGFLKAVIPLIIAVLSCGGLARLFALRTVRDVVHVLVLAALAPFFLLVVSPAQQQIADHHAAMSAAEIAQSVTLIGQAHLVIFFACCFALWLHASRFQCIENHASASGATPSKNLKKQ